MVDTDDCDVETNTGSGQAESVNRDRSHEYVGNEESPVDGANADVATKTTSVLRCPILGAGQETHQDDMDLDPIQLCEGKWDQQVPDSMMIEETEIVDEDRIRRVPLISRKPIKMLRKGCRVRKNSLFSHYR